MNPHYSKQIVSSKNFNIAPLTRANLSLLHKLRITSGYFSNTDLQLMNVALRLITYLTEELFLDLPVTSRKYRVLKDLLKRDKLDVDHFLHAIDSGGIEISDYPLQVVKMLQNDSKTDYYEIQHHEEYTLHNPLRITIYKLGSDFPHYMLLEELSISRFSTRLLPATSYKIIDPDYCRDNYDYFTFDDVMLQFFKVDEAHKHY